MDSEGGPAPLRKRPPATIWGEGGETGREVGGLPDRTGGAGEASRPCAAPVDCARIRLLFDGAPRTLFGAALAAVLAVPFLWPQIAGGTLAAWLAVSGVVIAGRLLLLLRYRRMRPDESRLCRWRDAFAAGGLLTGLVWGLMGAHIAWAGEAPYQPLFLCLLAGTAVMSISVTAPVLRAYLAYALPALVPPAVVLFARGGEIALAMGAVMGAASLFLPAMARSYNAVVTRAVTAAMEKDGFLNDLTAAFHSLQTTDRALKASEENLRRAQEVARVGSWHLDMTTNTLTWSDETHRMFGIPRGTPLTYEAFLDCVHPDDRPSVDRAWTAALSGVPYDIEHRICMEGDVRWVRERAKVEFDGAGRPLWGTGTVQDITLQRAAEAEMRLLKAAVESAAESVIVTDAAGTVIYVNPAFERASGYAKAEAVGQNPRILKSGRQDEAFYRRLWDTITRGEVWSGAFVNKRKDGTLYDEEAVISPIRDARGQVVNYVCVKRDVTKEKDIEAELRERQKMEAVGKLAGGIAHEFNNMLSVINGYAEMVLRKMKPDDPSASSIEAIREAGDRAASITQELLAFSRKQVISPRPMNINATVSIMKAMLRPLVGEDIGFAASLAPDLWLINADPSQIEQVLMNLVVNARDAMPWGGTITIETANVMLREGDIPESGSGEPGAYVMLAVTDTGTGMDEATLARIFEPFFTTKETGKGTGLGLAVVYGIVKQSGGHIRVCSEPGLGTTFRIYFPMRGGRCAGAESADIGASTGEMYGGLKV